MPDGQFGPYRLVQQIAVGGMAEIHLAKTKGIAGFEKFVVLKMIHPNFSQDQQFIEMLIDEAKLTVQLQHVNIAQTFDLGRVDETFYITMEFVDGADLYKLLRTGAEVDLDIPIEVAGFIAKEVANGLDYAHRKRDIHGQPLGIVHRDVSPQNVLISYSGEVKLVDFGIAKATMRARQTAVGVIKGKYYYMSPEQAWGETLDPRSDIFSTGILLYEMLTGQMLYLEEDLHKLLGMVRKADIASPTTLRQGIPPRLERIVMRALARKPENRYQSAADLAADLERFLQAHSPVFTQTKVVKWMDEVVGVRKPLAERVVPEPPSGVDAARNTQAIITRDQLFLDGSEFTDHNSVIFDAGELDAERGAQIRGTTDGGVEVESGPNEKLGSSGRRRSRAKSTEKVPPLPSQSSPPLRRDNRSFNQPKMAAVGHAPMARSVELDEPTLMNERGPRGPTVGALGEEFIREFEDEFPDDFHDFEESPTIAKGHEPLPPRVSRLDQNVPRLPDPVLPFDDGDFSDISERTVVSGPPAMVSPANRSSAPFPGRIPTQIPPLPGPLSNQTSDLTGEIANGLDGEATLSTEEKTMPEREPFHGLNEPTEIAEQGPTRSGRGIQSRPQGVISKENGRGNEGGSKPKSSWEAAPALAAANPKPAVSAIRPPRQSRRTPTSMPAQTGSVLSNLLQKPGRVPRVAMSQPTGSDVIAGQPRNHAQQFGQSGDRSEPDPVAASRPMQSRGPGFPQQVPRSRNAPSSASNLPRRPHVMPFPGANPVPMNTSMQMAAVEVDDIPDRYKLSHGRSRTPWIIGVVVLVALVGTAVIASLAGDDGDEAPKGQLATIDVVSTPPGGDVSVDGQPIGSQTPAVFRAAAQGKTYIVAVQLAKYQRWESEVVVPKGERRIKVIAQLQKLLVELTVETEPSDAEVFLNGKSYGRTPLSLPDLDPGTATELTLRLRNYEPVSRRLDWSTEREKALRFKLRR